MKSNNLYFRYFTLFMPWAFATAFQSAPEVSYLIAYLGSYLIFWLTLSGWVKPIPTDRTIAEQLMRPLFIVQIIFAGFMCCTTIFYFFDVLGYTGSNKLGTNFLIDEDRLQLTAQCQRYYVLGHAAFVTGILIFMKYPVKKKYHIEISKLANLLMLLALVSFPVSLMFLRVSGLQQFYFQLSSLSFISGTLALAFAIPLKKFVNTAVCSALYVFNFYQAFLSGFKEPIIVSIMVLGIFLYPNYKKAVMLIFIPLLLLLFTFLPTYIGAFRQNAWGQDEAVEDASQSAIDATLSGSSDETKETNTTFVVYRLSEVDMFIRFIKSTPDQIDFYGFQIVEQAAIVIIPRIFWPGKPITEDLVMERVYNAGVVWRGSNVSAKPAFIVDAYLSFGGLGVFIFLFLYGATAQLIALKAEFLFGGYIMGTALIFSGLFQLMWRGLSLEFLINSVFWSYITMIVIHKILLVTGILKEFENSTD